MSVPDDVLFLPIAELSRRIRAGDLSPVDLAQAFLDRIARWQPVVNAFVTVTPDRALADARAAQQDLAAGRWRGPLHGIPYALADTIDTAGIRTTRGAAPFADRVPDEDATVVARLGDAGAVLLGKLSTIELGGGLGHGTAAAALNGPCKNPWDPSRWAGGPSSGAGAAVAARLAAFAIAADGAGSLAEPAAFCGATALRPTFGAVPRGGAMPLGWTLDRLGPVARSAEDAALVLAAVAGPDPRDPDAVAIPRAVDRVRPALPKGLRVAALPFPAGAPAAKELRDAYDAARSLLRDGGAILDEEPALPPAPARDVARLLLEAEAVNALEDVIRDAAARAALADPSHAARKPDDYLPRASSADYVRAARIRGELQRALASFFVRYDAVLAPGRPAVAPPLGADLRALPAGGPLGDLGQLAGLPEVTAPMGFVSGLPVALELAGPPFDDARVLAAAAWYQARTPFHPQRPPEPAPPPAAAPPAAAAPRQVPPPAVTRR